MIAELPIVETFVGICGRRRNRFTKGGGPARGVPRRLLFAYDAKVVPSNSLCRIVFSHAIDTHEVVPGGQELGR